MKNMRIEYILKAINIVKGRVHAAFLGNDKTPWKRQAINKGTKRTLENKKL